MRHSKDTLEGMEMTFEVFMNDEGKPRAKNMEVFHPSGGYPPYGPPMGSPYGPPMGPPMVPMGHWMGPPMGHPMGPPMGPVDGQIFYGEIVRYDPGKGFGFIKCEPLHEDIFFLRSEMPPELKEEGKGKVIGVQVEFEIGHRDDGKLRARGLMLVPPPHAAGGRPGGRHVGKVLKYDDVKGFGFLGCKDLPVDVFFMRSGLPNQKRDLKSKDLIDLEMSFEFHYNEEGKPRAQALELVSSSSQDGRRRDAPDDRGEGTPLDGDSHTGIILRFEPRKGYGFLKPSDINEDVFFLRQELPEDVRGTQSKDDVVNREVQFEVRSMPDGKLRAMRLEFTGRSGEGRSKGTPPPGRPGDHEVDALDDVLLEEMKEFLRESGGGFDYGKFANKFKGIKKKQLEEHFDIVNLDERGAGHAQRIELREGDADADVEADGPGVDGDVEAPSMDDPAIPLGPGVQPHGVIRNYDAKKGYGFILCPGYPEDIYFARIALPTNFHGKNPRDMPNLAGIQVSFEFQPDSDKGPRADRMSLLLKWHTDDKCWLLKREHDTD